MTAYVPYDEEIIYDDYVDVDADRYYDPYYGDMAMGSVGYDPYYYDGLGYNGYSYGYPHPDFY